MHLPKKLRLRIPSRQIIVLAAGAVLGLVGLTLLGVAAASQVQPAAPAHSAAGVGADKPPPAVHALPQSNPVSISIAAIGVSSSLVYEGKNPNGSLQIPTGADVDRAAWYKYSPTPGEYGASVIEGHVDTVKSGPSVFFRLGDLKPGDVIEVKRSDGLTAVFSVSSVQQYSKDSFPTLTVYGPTNYASLRLITCGGDYDSVRGHYLKNTVVFAALSRTIKS